MVQLNPSVTIDVDDTLTGSTSGLNNINLLQPTSFKLVIDRKNFPNLEFFCQSVAHPAMDARAAELPYKRIGSVPFAADKLTFTDLECMIIVDENMNAYTEMYNWMQRLIQTKNTTPLERLDSKPPTVCDVTLMILSSANNTTRKIKYIDCIPVGLGNMVMEATTGDTTQITFPATFRFSYFELS